MKRTFYLADEAATEALAGRVANACTAKTVVFLNGDLGAGKSSFCRGFIHALGYQGRVKSPTYTLVEPYEVGPWRVFHFDLYRLSDPEELEFIGIRDYFEQDCLCLIEWPDKGADLLASEDLAISIDFESSGRRLQLEAMSDYGRQILDRLQ